MADYIKTCPLCKANLVGRQIPEKDREAFGGATHGSRLVAVCSREHDRTMYFKCPDCDGQIDRRDAYQGSTAGQFRTTNVQTSTRKGKE